VKIPQDGKIIIKVTEDNINERLDNFLASQLEGYSRSFFQKLIRSGRISVNNQNVKSSFILKENDTINIEFPEKLIPQAREHEAELVSIPIVFEHEDFIVIEKPAGLIVHSPHSNYEEITLVDWLKNRYPQISKVGEINRPGIVHRLDKNTSGLMIITLSPQGHAQIGKLFKDKKIQKKYMAIVEGRLENSGFIDYPLIRNPKEPHKRMAIKDHYSYANAKEAYTKYSCVNNFKNYSLVLAEPKTGRTHQIRVHFAAIGHPLVGDTLYGAKELSEINRHALHAAGLEFEYKGEKYNFSSELPKDIKKLMS